MKFSVFTVIMQEYSLEEAARHIKAAGYDGVEWRVHETKHVSPEDLPQKADEVRRITADAGLEISALAPYVPAGAKDRIERILEGARIMGCPQVRVGVPGYDRSRNYNELFDQALRELGEVQKIAMRTGVRANIEIHMGNIACSPSLAHRIVSRFDPKYIGVIFDPGNMVYEGYENYRLGLELLGPYNAHVHVKNAAWEQVAQSDGSKKWQCNAADMRGGIADWKQIVTDLKAVGYTGYLSLEDFSDKPALVKIKEAIEYLEPFTL